MSYERITYQNFSSIKLIPLKKGYRKIKKRANYRYDALNRITGATGANTSNYDLDLVQYDKNGNITNLERKGHTNTGATNFGIMDNLTYSYDSGNKLMKVADASGKTQGFKDGTNGGDDYTYDDNGNLLTDENKGITSISYNHLNLPTEIKFDNNNDKKINYTYDATGVKLKKVVNDGGSLTTTDYANGYIYENSELQFFNHPEGYVHNDNGTFKYVYNYLDHLGSIRLSYSDGDGNGIISQSEIIKENHYYPYGLKLRGFNSNVSSLGNSVAQKYMFNGKEFDDSFNETLNTYDFGARNYDPALGRWMNLDPLAEQMRRHSPYNYAFNNPIFFIDPDGMAPDTVIITGDEAEKATEQLNASSSLEITRNAKGVLSASGEAATKQDKALLKAINDKNVTVNLDATSSHDAKDGGSLFGGSFDGNSQGVDLNGEVVANQTVNPNQAEIIEDFSGAKKGSVVMHEVLEAYTGGEMTFLNENIKGSSSESNISFLIAHELVNSNFPDLNVEGLMNSQSIKVSGAISDKNKDGSRGTVTATLSKPDGSKATLFVNKNTKLY